MSQTSNTDRYLSSKQLPARQPVNDKQALPCSQQVDEQAAVAALGGNAELLRELGTMFCEDAPQVLNELQRAVSAGDTVAARRAAHSIKGLAGTFFARKTSEIALRIEKEAAEGNLAMLKADEIEHLRHSIQELSDELEQRGLKT